VAELRAAFVKADPVVRAVGRGDDALDDVLAAIGQEIGSLRWERSRLAPSHPNSAIITTRIIHGLLQLGHVALVQPKLRHGHLDIRGTRFRAVFKAFMAELQAAVEETLPGDAKVFMTNFSARLVGWEAKADAIIRGP
jgi:hypothetical protein